MDLSSVSTLIVDDDHFTRSILVQILRAFGVTSPVLVDNAKQAKAWLANHVVDLCICEAVLPDGSAASLIRWIRRRDPNPVRFIPIIVLTGYTQRSTVAQARDAGASIVVKKPVSPRTLYDHIAWVAKSKRPFVEAGRYIGPDRRFKEDGPPAEGERRYDVDYEEEGDEMEDAFAVEGQP
jgi:CheY-like chemotaxis protein